MARALRNVPDRADGAGGRRQDRLGRRRSSAQLGVTASLTNVLAFASIPTVAVVLGGVFASIRTPSPAVRSGVQHIAAGVLFAALATELLPDVVPRCLSWGRLGDSRWGW